MRGATIVQKNVLSRKVISTHTPHAGRDIPNHILHGAKRISTHTPHAGRDRGPLRYVRPGRHFYSHAPCGARLLLLVIWSTMANFYSHAPCGARPSGLTPVIAGVDFYSHAPCGARQQRVFLLDHLCHFYSHAPCGARHAVVIQGDTLMDFYSHAPCGARLRKKKGERHGNGFLLTRPMRGATNSAFCPYNDCTISTHTPHAGRDKLMNSSQQKQTISTHTPHAGRDAKKHTTSWKTEHFYSHAPCGARRGR